MAQTPTVFIGMGAIRVLVAFFVSTVVCGVGVLFIILGLVISPRHDDD